MWQPEEVQQLPGGGLLQPCLPGAALEGGRAQAGVRAAGGGQQQRWRWRQHQELIGTAVYTLHTLSFALRFHYSSSGFPFCLVGFLRPIAAPACTIFPRHTTGSASCILYYQLCQCAGLICDDDLTCMTERRCALGRDGAEEGPFCP